MGPRFVFERRTATRDGTSCPALSAISSATAKNNRGPPDMTSADPTAIASALITSSAAVPGERGE